MKKTKEKYPVVPDLTEFTDQEGKRWVQTSADDLLSTRELNSILNALEMQKSADEIVLARIDFQKVNKEYYEAVVDLQSRLEKQNKMLKKLLIDAKQVIDKKNKKLNELVEYIKKLHIFIAYNNKISPEDIEKMMVAPPEVTAPPPREERYVEEIIEKKVIEYTDVEEELLDEEAKVVGKVKH